jgi:DNA end-binding protein Ku
MPRGLWKGAISFGLVNVPVELVSGEKRSGELHFTLLDKRDMAPVGYQRVNKASGKEVPWKEIVKGYEYDDDRYVVLSDEDFRRANVQASKTVEILAFVDLAEIAPQYFSAPYYLLPGKRGEKAYALLRDALAKSGKAGIATFVIRSKQHLAALLPQADALLLSTLRFADELREPKELEIPSAKATPKERALALKLIEDMTDAWKPQKYHDTYREDILARVKAKVKAGQTEELTEPEAGEAKPKAEVIDLMAALRKSVEHKPERKAHARKTRKRRAA